MTARVRAATLRSSIRRRRIRDLVTQAPQRRSPQPVGRVLRPDLNDPVAGADVMRQKITIGMDDLVSQRGRHNERTAIGYACRIVPTSGMASFMLGDLRGVHFIPHPVEFANRTHVSMWRMQAMTQTHSGGCQCGRVRYEVEMDIGEVLACNCSRCGRLGSFLAFAPATQFKLLSGSGDLTKFEFNKHMIEHQFCSTCGIQSFAMGTHPKSGEKMAAINVRCVDGVDVDTLRVKKVDGRGL